MSSTDAVPPAASMVPPVSLTSIHSGSTLPSIPLSACIDQRRGLTSKRTFTIDQQPPMDTIDHYHYGGFPQNRVPHRDFTHEKRHFFHLSNKQSERKEEIIRVREEPKFTSLEDRPQGTRRIAEADVYADIKAASFNVKRGCKHFPPKTYSEQREFVTSGKRVQNMAQRTSSHETTIEETFGRITRLSEKELHDRNERVKCMPIEQTKDFYKTGACIAPVNFGDSRSSKSLFGFEGLDLKSRLISEKLWKENSRRNQHQVDERKMKTYKEVAAERALQYEQKLVSDLPDEVKPPVEDFAPPPEVVVAKEETKKEKRAREKKEKLSARK